MAHSSWVGGPFLSIILFPELLFRVEVWRVPPPPLPTCMLDQHAPALCLPTALTSDAEGAASLGLLGDGSLVPAGLCQVLQREELELGRGLSPSLSSASKKKAALDPRCPFCRPESAARPRTSHWRLLLQCVLCVVVFTKIAAELEDGLPSSLTLQRGSSPNLS